ncbi:MAG: MFS transporter [Phycisphaeraceae bacterium]|nr:MFS transporter [Phycisphaeraceae bacterium]
MSSLHDNPPIAPGHARPLGLLRTLAGPLASFHPETFPAVSRTNYRRELIYTFLFSTALAVVEGGILGVLVTNAFAGAVPDGWLAAVVALLGAAPEGANITSFLWISLAHGRDKVRFINRLQLITIVLAGVIAIVPQNALGLALLVAAVISARVCITGVITLRAALWRANYSRFHRARATGKFSTISVLVIAVTGFLFARSMDAWEESFRLFIPLVCVLGLLGTVAYGHIRMRGGKASIKAERTDPSGSIAAFRPGATWKLLREDRNYARFMGSMFLLGFGNLMLPVPLVLGLKDRFAQGYQGSIVVISSIPLLVMPWFIPLWARLLAKVHVVRFRSIHSWFFVAAQAIVMLAFLTQSYWMLYISAFSLGVAYGGGSLAWNLGHLDFAPGPKASAYMGVHVTLNGIRGVTAPFFAAGMYRTAEQWSPGLGWTVFAASVVLCILGALGFVHLSRSMGDSIRRPKD